MNHITIQYATDQSTAPPLNLLKKWAKQTLKNRADQAEITIRIMDSEEMLELNSTYRQKAYATNVLSFPLAHHPLIGDIAICAEVVNREAKEQHKTSESHWAHMIVHGLLHLLGYDHVHDEDAVTMEALEIEILHHLGFSNPYHPESNKLAVDRHE